MVASGSAPTHDDAQEKAVAVSPAPITQIAFGFMAAKHLFAASELRIFEALAGGPATLDEVAQRTGLSRRTARISADAMAALGLLERDGDQYRNGEAAATFLAGRTPADLRPFLRFWNRLSYPAWAALEETLRGNWRARTPDPVLQEIFSSGVESFTAGPARALAAGYDFSTHRRLLDVGGGTGSLAAAIAERHPHMRATVVEAAEVVPLARARLEAAGLAQRIDAVVGDALAGPYPEGHDVVLLANLVHYFGPERNRRILELARAAVGDGARLLIVDFWTDATHTSPLPAALMAGEFAVLQEEGDVYSVDDVRGWLGDAGWRFLDHRPLEGPISLVVAEAAPRR